MDEPMTFHDLQAWQESMGYTQAAAAVALGVSRVSYRRLATGISSIDKRTALACAAIEARLEPWRVRYEMERGICAKS